MKAIGQSWRRLDYRFEHCLAVLVAVLSLDMDLTDSVHDQYQSIEVVLDYFVSSMFNASSLAHWYATALCLKQYSLGDPHYSRSEVPSLYTLRFYTLVDHVCGE